MSIYTSTDLASRPTLYLVRGSIYSANDSDKVKVIDPLTEVAYDAGLAAPTTVCPTPVMSGGGALTAGTHLFRYRWRNSKTGYVSNPSTAVSATATAGQQATITIGAGEVSADARVDEIIIEMTATSSGDYYLAATRANSAGTVVVSMTDLTLFQQQSIAETWGGPGDSQSYDHNAPPLAAFGFEHNGIHFVGGGLSRSFTGTFSNGSATVNGTGFSANWTSRIVQASGDTATYKQTSATATTLTLSSTYAGTTGSKTFTLYPAFPNRVYWSLAGYPESFNSVNRARDTLRARGDTLTSGISHGGRAFFFGLASSEYWSFNTDPADAQVVPIPGNRGNFNPRTLVGVDGVLFAWDRQGMYAVTGTVPERISDDVVPFLDNEVDFTQSAKFHAGFDPVDRQILFFYVKQGDTQPKYAAAYDVDGKRWTVNAWRQGITACCSATTAAGDVRLMLGDEYGKTWYYGLSGWRDGYAGDGALVAQTGTTSSSIVLAEPLDTTTFTWAGVMVTNPVTDESRPISSVSVDGLTVTLATAFTSAPAVGSTLHFGEIPLEYESKWFVGGSQAARKRPVYLLLKLHPSNQSGTMTVRFYADFRTTPLTYTRSSSYKWPNGVTASDRATAATVDLAGGTSEDGVVRVPIPAGWTRAVKAVISWTKPVGRPQILDLEFEQDEREGGNAD